MKRATKLTPEIARRILEAEREYTRRKKLTEQADETRKELRAHYRHLFKYGAERRIAGISIKVSRASTGPAFRIAGFLAKHKLTEAMKPFYSPPGQRDDWRVKELEKP